MREIIKILATELKGLEHEFRVELPKEISVAVAMGDLRENAEYHAALERQAFVRARIGQLRIRLSELSATDVSRIPKDRVGLGSTVKVLDTDSNEELTFKLVVPEVSDLDSGMISVASPIGRSLVGAEEGDEVEAEIPSGTRNFEILELKTIHDS